MIEYHFKIIIPFYNVEKWIQMCLKSVQLQTYKNFQCIVIDDISTDNSHNAAQAMIKNDDRFVLIKNKEKAYALKNIHDAINTASPAKNDIIVSLDGDDWFANNKVLETLNNKYNETDCWMTYGSYVEYPSGIEGKFAKQIPDYIIENRSYRESEWMTSHLRTFKHALWEKIDKNDFIFSQTNKFVKAAWDLAFVFPMLEMSGKKALYISDVLYVYNRGNPLNEDKVDHPLQLSEEQEMRNKTKYKLQETLE